SAGTTYGSKMSFTTSSGMPSTDTSSGLQAYYTFDEGSGTTATDSSGNNRDGTITGATWTTGKIGGALNFDGNGYVTIPGMNYDEISVSAWFNKNTSGTNVVFGGWRYNADVQLQEGFDMFFSSGMPDRLKFTLVTKNTGGTRTSKTATKDFTESNGSWYHVVGTYNMTTGEQKLYVDGQLVDTQTHPTGNAIVPLTNRDYMAIGTRYTDWGFFSGSIDEVRIYNQALNAEEVLSLFNNDIVFDTTPPTVIATSPVSNATEVAVDSTIIATFSEAIDASSITTDTFLVSDSSGNIGGTISYSDTTATFTPSGPLAYSTTYTVTVTTGVRDVSGNAMTDNYICSFTTTEDGGISGQQAYYKFDEGSGTTATDSSGNNRSGTITGATWTTGEIGGALNFDGNGYVTIPGMNYDEISVSAWFNKNRSGTNVVFGGWKYNADVQLQEGFDMFFSSGMPDRLKFTLVTKNTGSTRTSKTATKDFTESNGSWYHVVGTYNMTTGEQKLYVDGQLVDTQTHPTGNVIVPLTNRDYMAIGTRYADWGFFRGSIDDVHIYNRALSDQEIQNLYTNGIN
uniref:LamG-like jellyroll fold domain-containing protein n=1 Tax=uncultured Candidatus Kuenenia sp. TaxID=1048336 RepID=UPI0025F628B9